MPAISAFFGIIIWMYNNDHLPPHFHAEHAEHEAKFSIETLEMFEGQLPRRAGRSRSRMGAVAPRGVARELGKGTFRVAATQGGAAGLREGTVTCQG